MLTFCNRHKSFFLGIFFTLLSFGAYAHSVAVFAEVGTGVNEGKVMFHALTWHSSREFGSRNSGSMIISGVGTFAFAGGPKSGPVPGRLVASCNGWSRYNTSSFAYQSTPWITGINLCNTLSFSMTRYYLEEPACNLSGSVNLSVPTVTAQPIANTTLCAATNYSLSVSATGASLSYQWQISTNGGATFRPIIASDGFGGFNTSTLTYSGVNVAMNGYRFRCYISSAAGCEGVPNNTTTNNSTLTVNSGVNITSQPANASVCSGGSASFVVNATGSGITYQWQISTNSGVNWAPINGATSPTLIINGATSNAIYRCVMNSSSACGGNTSNNAELTVTPASVITGNSSTTTICEDNPTPATLTVTATGSNLTYQWQVSTNGGATFNNVSGSSYSGGTSASLSISNAPASLNGARYRCLVSGNCGSLQTSNQISLVVNSKPLITLSPVSKSVCENGSTTFTSAANGTSVTYQWQLNGVDLSNTAAPYSNVNSSILTISNPDPSLSGGSYRVLVSSGVGCGTTVTSTTATLTVSAIPTITGQPATSTTICEGINSSISLTATGAGLSYRWQDRAIGSSGAFSNTSASSAISGVNSNTLNITGAPGSVAKEYIVQVAGTCGTTSSTVAVLNVTLLPRVTVAPLSISACTGSGTTLSVTATGTDLSYQWQVSSTQTPTYTNISDDATYSNTTSSTLTILPTVSLTGNLYRAALTNNCATVYSTPGTLTVNSTPNIAIEPVDMSLCEFTSGTISVTSSGNGLQYQWYEQTLTGTTWTPLTNSRNTGTDDFSIAGATTNQLRLSSVPYSKNGFKYKCEISSSAGCGSALTSTVSTVTVWQRPTITLEPINSNNNYTSTVSDPTYTFKTQVSGEVITNDLDNVFTWFESTNGGRTFSSSISNSPTISNTLEVGIPTSLLTISMPKSRSVEDRVKYLYRCLITGVCQNKTTKVVRINPPPKIK